MTQPWMKFIAGAEVWEALETEKERIIPKNGQYYRSEELCHWQAEVSRRGVIGVEIVQSIYGHSVRYDSGLQDFALLAGSRYGQLDGTFTDAARYAREWCAVDPARRYAWFRE